MGYAVVTLLSVYEDVRADAKAPNIARVLRLIATDMGWTRPQAAIAKALGFGTDAGQVNKWWTGARPVGDILNLDRLKSKFPAYAKQIQAAYEADRALAKLRRIHSPKVALSDRDAAMLEAMRTACDGREDAETEHLILLVRGLRGVSLKEAGALLLEAARRKPKKPPGGGAHDDAG